MIYVVEDDEFIRDGLVHLLQEEQYQVEAFDSIRTCEQRLEMRQPDLMILDVVLQDGNGFDFCERLRRRYSFPVLFLTCHDEEYNTVRGFESGGDDYVTKPFRVKELLLRVRALLRRSYGQDGERSEPFRVDTERRKLFLEGKEIELTPTEFMLFQYLWKHTGKTVARQELLYYIWDSKENYVDENTLNVHVSSLRKKLGSYGWCLETVRGFGYLWRGNV